MILSPWYRLKRQADAVGAGVIGAPVATITTIYNGAFSLAFYGSTGGDITVSDGVNTEVLTLNTTVFFNQTYVGSLVTITISGALDEVRDLYWNDLELGFNLTEIAKFKNAKNIAIRRNNSVSGDIASVAFLEPWSANFEEAVCVCSDVPFGAWGGTGAAFNFRDCFVSADDLGRFLIGLDDGGMSTCTLYVDGTNPAPPNTSEVIAAIVSLNTNGVTLFTN